LQLRRFEFKAVSPPFEGSPIILRARRKENSQISLWASDAVGLLAMSACAEVIHS
jgi:hydroxyacyl-ACP dehydratase HTD2-like protein with hotdog domain